MKSLLKENKGLWGLEKHKLQRQLQGFFFLLQGLHLPDENGREKRHKGLKAIGYSCSYIKNISWSDFFFILSCGGFFSKTFKVKKTLLGTGKVFRIFLNSHLYFIYINTNTLLTCDLQLFWPEASRPSQYEEDFIQSYYAFTKLTPILGRSLLIYKKFYTRGY